MKKNFLVGCLSMLTVAVLPLLVSCDDTIDNFFSLNKSEIEITPSDENIKLDESKPGETALTLDWTTAYDYGNEYITTYKYEMQVNGSSATKISEYEDDGNFHRSFTNEELQQLLVDHFGVATSTPANVIFTVTASFEGPTLKVPDIATANVVVKTYGAKQFRADHLYMAGSAVGDDNVELSRSESDTLVYSWMGQLSAGNINFPVTNYDENNAIGPSEADAAITTGDMAAVITDENVANSWVIPAADTYRVTVNLRNHTVRIIAPGATVEADQLFLAGSAVGDSQVELPKTLENDDLFAWKGQLKAGKLYIPVTFEGEQSMAIVPNESDDHDIHDGQSQAFTQVALQSAVNGRSWTIPADGTYRVVADKGEKTITIYSSATDLQSKVVSWNNTTLKINPYTAPIDTLWMYGTFNSFAHDTGMFTGYQEKYILRQSTANPYVFVYKGDVLPRLSAKDERGTTVTASVNFKVDNHNNNVYCFGSTADAKRNDHNGYIEAKIGETLNLVAGQSHNRYAYFIIPEGCNYIEVNIDKLTVVFDKRD